MRDDRFEWDDTKAASNARKHGITFTDSREAFDDPNALEEADPDPDGDRMKLTGRTNAGVLVVIYVERHARIRVISARKATRHEEAHYQRQAIH